MKEEGSHMASDQSHTTGQPLADREHCRDPAHESGIARK